MKRYLEAGKFVSTHGVHGELKLYVWGDGPEQVCSLKKLYLDERGEREAELVSARPNNRMALVAIKGVDSPEEARKYIEHTVWLDRNDLVLPEGSCFVQDLIGLEAVDAESGKNYGTLEDVTSNGAHDIYHFRYGERTVMVPAVSEFIIKTDIEAGKIWIKPIKGMFEDED